MAQNKEKKQSITTNLLTWQIVSTADEPEIVASPVPVSGPGLPQDFFTGIYGYNAQAKVSAALNLAAQDHAFLRFYKVNIANAGNFVEPGTADTGLTLRVAYAMKKALRVRLEAALGLQISLLDAVDQDPEILGSIFSLDDFEGLQNIIWAATRNFGNIPIPLYFCTIRDASRVLNIERLDMPKTLPVDVLRG